MSRTASSREGSIRGVSAEMDDTANALWNEMASPPLATRQLSPSLSSEGSIDTQHSLKEKFKDALRLRKMSPEAMLAKGAGREDGKQKSHPLEVLSTAEVKEKIQQLGRPLAQSRTSPSPQQTGDASSVASVGSMSAKQTSGAKKDSPSPTPGGAFGRTITPPRGRGLTLEKYHQLSESGGSDRNRDTPSPVGGNHGRMSPLDNNLSPGLNSSSEILQNAATTSMLSPRSPLASDLSSSEEADPVRKQRALAYLQQMAAVSAEEGEHRMVSPSGSGGDALNKPASEQNRVTSPVTETKAASATSPGVDRPPFHVMSESELARIRDEVSPTLRTKTDGGALRKEGTARSSRRYVHYRVYQKSRLLLNSL